MQGDGLCGQVWDDSSQHQEETSSNTFQCIIHSGQGGTADNFFGSIKGSHQGVASTRGSHSRGWHQDAVAAGCGSRLCHTQDLFDGGSKLFKNVLLRENGFTLVRLSQTLPPPRLHRLPTLPPLGPEVGAQPQPPPAPHCELCMGRDRPKAVV